ALLDHAVAPAPEFVIAIRKFANDVTRSIPAALAPWQERFGRIFRQIPIPVQNARTGDTQLSFRTAGDFGTDLINHKRLAVRTRFTDRNGFTLGLRNHLWNLVKRADVGLRRTVEVEVTWVPPERFQ